MENLIALIGFVFVATITPGPVNSGNAEQYQYASA